jgi:hypothetical protein
VRTHWQTHNRGSLDGDQSKNGQLHDVGLEWTGGGKISELQTKVASENPPFYICGAASICIARVLLHSPSSASAQISEEFKDKSL